MRDLAETLLAWPRFAVASVVGIRGSAPRELGASMAVGPTGEVIGSVSGGCVEAAVHDLALDVLATSQPTVATFGYSDDDAFAVGLTCGGELDVLVQPDTPPLRAALRAATAGIPLSVRFEAAGHIYTETWQPPPRLLVFGAIDHAAAVAEIGRFLGYRVTVCDARPIFATPQRFPAAHEVVVNWPHRYLATTATDDRTAVIVLTHDPKFDIPVLSEALTRPLAFVGALGSRRTHLDRLARLREAGVPEAALTRLRSPVGLDLGGRTPAETAVSIAAELVALRHGGTGLPLSDLTTPIHRAEPGIHGTESGIHGIESGIHRTGSGIDRTGSGIDRTGSGETSACPPLTPSAPVAGSLSRTSDRLDPALAATAVTPANGHLTGAGAAAPAGGHLTGTAAAAPGDGHVAGTSAVAHGSVHIGPVAVDHIGPVNVGPGTELSALPAIRASTVSARRAEWAGTPPVTDIPAVRAEPASRAEAAGPPPVTEMPAARDEPAARAEPVARAEPAEAAAADASPARFLLAQRKSSPVRS